MSSAESWFYAREDERLGPVSQEELRRMVQSGDLAPEALVWTPGMGDWQPAVQVEALDIASADIVAPLVPPPPGRGAVAVAPATVAQAQESSAKNRLVGWVVAGTAVAGALLSWLLVDPILVPNSGAEISNVGRYALRALALLVACAVVFLPVARLIQGRWPFQHQFDEWLGPRESDRRWLILGSALGLLIYLFFFAPLDSGQQVESGTRAVLMAFVYLAASGAAGLLVVGRWLRGQWPALGALADLWAQYNPWKLMTPWQRHVALSFAVGLVPTALVLVAALQGETLAEVSAGLRIFTWSWLFFSFLAYFPVGYLLFGEWPLVELLKAIIGSERSLQRRLSFALAPVAVQYFFTARDLPADQLTPDVWIPLALTFVVVYYLAGFTVHWQASNDHAHMVLDGLQEHVPEVRRDILATIFAHRLNDLDIRELEVAETGVHPVPLALDVTRTQQVQITRRGARVILRVLGYGEDLYIRWESFFDMSGRRIWLLFGLFYSLINGILIRFTTIGLVEITERVKNILLPWRGLDTTGAQLRQTVDHASFATAAVIPSYMLDDLYALEDIVNHSATQTLDATLATAGREEKVRLAIDRGGSAASSQLF